ncbi:hypothetical protein putatively related to meiosis protein [Trichophyton benhamiae CBS 112371]|uniref:Uncharacterized protein n=1 Tax=Arthroderma benhamiae (strain ATCC MYA-4681 / CBS 112371) TaxID=663331 RepID=D4AJ26_ARTBC|nr:hypothetical protein putatively related to meiosis protein [Trichophyton benhamiae CBS 112371]EFE36749.1 hypothetical protein putatively related to meiosis protein [Trichophyton benhamiae CBS 112371]
MVPAIQGKDCLVQKFRNSSVMLEHPSFRPKIFHTGTGPMAGTEDHFPGPDNPSKMRRSVENAEHVGMHIIAHRYIHAVSDSPYRLVRSQIAIITISLDNSSSYLPIFHAIMNLNFSGSTNMIHIVDLDVFFFCSLPLLLIFNYLSGNLSTLLAFFSSSLHVLSFPFFHLSFYFPAFCLLPYIPHIPRKHRSNQASTELGQTRPYPQEHPRQTLVQHIYLPGFAFADLGIKAIAALFNYQVSLTPILPFLFFLLLSLALP